MQKVEIRRNLTQGRHLQHLHIISYTMHLSSIIQIEVVIKGVRYVFDLAFICNFDQSITEVITVKNHVWILRTNPIKISGH